MQLRLIDRGLVYIGRLPLQCACKVNEAMTSKSLLINILGMPHDYNLASIHDQTNSINEIRLH